MECKSGGTMLKISQCMIVKNEEKNIERALSWAKSIVCQQVVVDTGSTDRTKEIAERMGAKVVDFEWIDDFSAAKNFAIEQATGDWILVFDADEYMSGEDTEKLWEYLVGLQNDTETKARYLAINCRLVNVDDNGKAMSVYDTMRVIKNDETIRYIGSIHERLDIKPENVGWNNDITVIHTGYSESSISETNKIERNIDLLRKAIEKTEDNLSLKVYLADSLKTYEDEESRAEADKYFAEAIDQGGDKIFYKLRVKAYIHFLNKFANDPAKRSEYEKMCNRALEEFPNSIDFEYYQASFLNSIGKYKEAWDLLKSGEERLVTGGKLGIAYHVQADPTMLYSQLLLAAQGLGDINGITENAMRILATDKSRMEIISPLIAILLRQGTSIETLITTLSDVYNINDPQDLLIIAKAAKNCGAVEFAGAVMGIAKELLG